MKIVLDTNVLVSGLLSPNGTPGRILAAWSAGKFDLMTRDAQMVEIARVLAHTKIRRRLAAHQEDATALLETSGAEVLVSGDGDLLALRNGHPVVPPDEFARRL